MNTRSLDSEQTSHHGDSDQARPANRVDLIEVAKAAGVSKSTASRALRGEARVSAQTTARVLQTAADLGYVRDLRAARLASTTRTTIGLLIRSAEQSFYGEVAARVQTETERRGLDLLIVSSADTHASQTRSLDNLLGHRVAGIMIASGRASMNAAERAATFVPTVLLGMHTPPHTMLDSIAIDTSAEALLAKKVIDAGHRCVAVTVSDRPESTTLKLRASHFEQKLKSNGVQTTQIHGAGEEGPEFVSGLRRAIEGGATAIMAGDDTTAVEILEFLADWGIDCPKDVSVTGFDGVGIFRSSIFGLTTIRQPVEDMAITAIETLLSRLDNHSGEATHTMLPGTFVPGRTLASQP